MSHLRLVVPPGQAPARPPRGRHARALFLTPDECRHLATSLHNLRRAFGTWACLADAMGVREALLVRAAANDRNGRGSPALALVVARVAGMSVEAVLSGTLSAAGKCEACGSRIGAAHAAKVAS